MTQGWPPAIHTEVSKIEREHGDGDKVIKFAETFCRVTKDSIGGRAGDLIKLTPWQKALTREVFSRRADGKYRFRQSYVGMPRKNAKSTLIACYALYSLVMGVEGGEVYCVASTKQQASIVFGTIKRMVQLDPDLAREIEVYSDSLYMPSTNSTLRTVAADAPALEGLNPTFTVLDEVHAWPATGRELWDVFALASGARREPMMVGITTAGKRTDSTGNDSLAYKLYQYGAAIDSGEIDDKSFGCWWWQPHSKDIAADDQKAWAQANPGLGTLIDPEEMSDSFKRTPETEFLTKRANLWVDASTAWMPAGKWDECALTTRTESADDRWVLGLDGSYSNDSTAVVAVSVEQIPHVKLVGLWERNDDPHWRVDMLEVERVIFDFAKNNQVTEIAVDPYRWARTMAVLQEQGLPVLEYPQSPVRLIPATQRLYEGVINHQLTQSGDPHLAKHISNAAVKVDSRGSRIIKSAYTRKIDAAIATVLAYDRACWHQEQPVAPKRRAYGFSY